MRVIKHSELLSFLRGLNPDGEVSEEEIANIIVDYNEQYMYTACITYDPFNRNWKCASIQPEYGTLEVGDGWRISPYGDSRTVRTAPQVREVRMTYPTQWVGGGGGSSYSAGDAEAVVPDSTPEERSSLRDLMARYMPFGRGD